MLYIQLPADARGYWARYCDLPLVNRPLSLLSQSLCGSVSCRAYYCNLPTV